MSQSVEASVDELVGKIRGVESELSSEEVGGFSADAMNNLSNLSGLSEDDLQKFLEEKSGMSAEEEAQGSVMAAAATAAVHC